MKIAPVILLVTALPFTCAATAAITDVAGSITKIRAPASVERQALESNVEIFAFKEVSKLTLTDAVYVNATAPGFYDATPVPATEFIPAGTVVDSYLLHLDHLDELPTVAMLGGTITFSGNIIGIIFLRDELEASNVQLGAPGTAYDVCRLEPPDTTTVRDFLTLAPDVKSITVLLNVTSQCDHVRIITTHSPVDPSGLEGVSD